MIPTITRGLRQLPVSDDDFQPWVNKELIPLLRQFRDSLNYTSVVKATIQTDGSNTPTVIWSSQDIASGTAVAINARVTARSSASRSAFEIVGYFYSQGTVTQEGVTTSIYSIDAAGLLVAFQIVANHIELEVTDPGGAIPFDWVAVIEAQEVP